ncbi:MAG TPA: hypothetical protein VFA59_18565, partial [Vicinamibacterales bacterium]|nr:hypothetical protein [Vicinamibacterales bacterium]
CGAWVAAEPNSAFAHLSRAIAFMATNSGNPAEDLDRAIQLNPRYAEAYATRAYYRRYWMLFDGAANDLEQAFRFGISDKKIEQSARNELTIVQGGQKCFHGSPTEGVLFCGAIVAGIKAAKNLGKEPPYSVHMMRPLLGRLGIAEFETGAYDLALEAFQNLDEARELYGEQYGGLWDCKWSYYWGQTYRQKGDVQRAFDKFYHCDNGSETDPSIRSKVDDALGLIWLERMQLRTAIDYFEHAIRDAPADSSSIGDVATYLVHRGIGYFLQGDLNKAMTEVKAALTKNPREAQALYVLGVIEQRNGDASGSAIDMFAATRVQPDIATVMEKMGIKP